MNSIFLAICLILSIGSIQNVFCALCDNRAQIGGGNEQFISLPQNQRSLTRGVSLLALQFDYILTHTSVPEGNILIAPINIMKTLGTIMLGAGGETEKELALVLGMAVGRRLSYNIGTMHNELGYLLTQVTTAYPGVQFGNNLFITGGVFVQRDADICENYVTYVKQIYRTQVIPVDFQNDAIAAVNTVNQWIANKTMNRITNLVEPPIARDTKAIIAGALFFNGDWEIPFRSRVTRWQLFYLGSEGRNSKQSISVQMMTNQGTVNYYKDDKIGYEAIGLQYKNKEVMMFVVLPKLNNDLKNVTYRLHANDIENMVHKSALKELVYVIPKMKLSSKINLRDPLEKIGVRTLFSHKRANFTNLADGVYADDVLHQVELEVNEVGTTAAAATSTSTNRISVDLFRVDRPFLFFIYNVKVDIITFYGSIKRPTPFVKE